MTLQEASILSNIQIGKLSGRYAEIFDARNNKLFSIQKRYIGDAPVVCADNAADTKKVAVRLLPLAELSITQTLTDSKSGQIEWRKPYTKLFDILDLDEHVYVNANAFDWIAA